MEFYQAHYQVLGTIPNYLLNLIPFAATIIKEREDMGDKISVTFTPSQNQLIITDEMRVRGVESAVSDWIRSIITDYVDGFERLAIPASPLKLYAGYKFKIMKDLPDNVIYMNESTYNKMSKDYLDAAIRREKDGTQ